MMTSISKLMCGITVLTVPTIAYGGYYLLTILSGYDKTPLTDFQKSMFRAGHVHAGVLVILSLVAQLLLDNTQMNYGLELAIRISFPLAAILISGGFFAAAAGPARTSPNRFIRILYLGALCLTASLIVLGIALLRNR
jgi:membrane protein DedA with SNARE-associated domain